MNGNLDGKRRVGDQGLDDLTTFRLALKGWELEIGRQKPMLNLNGGPLYEGGQTTRIAIPEKGKRRRKET